MASVQLYVHFIYKNKQNVSRYTEIVNKLMNMVIL